MDSSHWYRRAAATRRRSSRWRRLVVTAVAPLLALAVTAPAQAQGVWLTLPSMPTPRAFAATAAADCPVGVAGTCVYSVGGRTEAGGEGVNTAEAYSPALNAWLTLPALPTARLNAGGATAPCPEGVPDSCVYVVGGFGGGATLDTVEAYSPATNTWLDVPSMPTARNAPGATAAPCPEAVDGLEGTCVYAIGGIGGGVSLATVEAYSPATNTWATLPDLPGSGVGIGAATAPCPVVLTSPGTCVYAVGGQGQAIVRAYNPTVNAWLDIPDLPTARQAAATAAPCPDGVENGCVYALDGFSFSDPADAAAATEAYSPVANTWATLPDLPTPRTGVGAATAPCPKAANSTCVYAVGGGIDPDGTVEAFAVERHAPGRDHDDDHGHDHRDDRRGGDRG
ncbi:kelch repeat-containing protein [Streptomyces sp. TRM64462]|uniref:Kelch repeat-containing protein n=1 Tax=Streptomyces sp. TRM64462 TaxID=2741726 RepID=UPI001585D519|nr:kelch repeat-containing protein [Streptomyces sp. TRM64462]